MGARFGAEIHLPSEEIRLTMLAKGPQKRIPKEKTAVGKPTAATKATKNNPL
jgi:hypothetical protein